MRTGTECTLHLREMLLARETATGGWNYDLAETQPHLEPTCLSLLALRYCAEPRVTRGLEFLLHTQNPNGSWPAFAGDDQEGNWVTALDEASCLQLYKDMRKRPFWNTRKKCLELVEPTQPLEELLQNEQGPTAAQLRKGGG